jgi:glutamyl-Q tRNA(Asp) synthetase
LHLGSLYTALAGFLRARALRGEWLLRIDDADGPRSAPGAADSILRALERHGLHWDGGVAYQSRALDTYRQALETLDRAGFLYPCACTRKTLAAADGAIYPGHCRAAGRDRSGPHALRVKTYLEVVTIMDGLRGAFSQNLAEEVGDFILLRRDGIYAYHLTAVVDDARAGITEVLRGMDLLDSAPRQAYLQRLLHLPAPAYLHVPVLVDAQGVKLSKQTGARAADERAPSANLFALLRLMGQNPPEELQAAPPEETLAWAIPAFDISRLNGGALVAPESKQT